MIDPPELPAERGEVLQQPAVRRALAARDIAMVFRALTNAGMSQRRLAGLTGMGASEVSEVLAGRRVMSYDVLLRIADGLGMPRGWMGLAYDEWVHHAYAGDLEASPPAEEMDEDMKRRAFLAAASVSLFGQPVLGELLEIVVRPETPTPLPAQVGVADVQALRGLTDRMRTLARQWGGQGDAMSAIAHRSTRLLSGPGTNSTKQALGSALAELHTEAGWCCFDSGLYDHAEQHFRRALEIAGEAGDSYQMAYTLRHIGIYLSETGGPNEGLKALQLGDYKLADARSDRAPALGAWLHAESAVALTRMNRPELARTELARARDGWEPPEAFDQADMDYAAAWVMAQLGDLDAAEALLDSSLGTWAGSSDRRDAVKAEITRATLHVRAGERNGLPMAEQVIRNVTELRGTRARARLAPLIDALAGRPDRDSRELAGHVHRVSVERV